MKSKNERVVCADGFSMSVQADEFTYCSPRIDRAEKYTQVEIGFPSEYEDLIIDWAEDDSSPTGTVYGYVPIHVVNLVLAKHGGMVSGAVPAGVAPLRSN